MFCVVWPVWVWVRVWPLSAPCTVRGAGTPELGRGDPGSGAFLPLVHLNTVNRELSSPGIDQVEELEPREKSSAFRHQPPG